MNNDKLKSFKKFNEELKNKKVDEASIKTSKQLSKATEEYHVAQLKLQELQKKFIGTSKENKEERETLKKAIIDQNKNVKQKEATFHKALGDEDIEDLEI